MNRLDRSVTLFLHNALQRHRRSKGNSIPILMYHSISPAENTASHPYYEVNTAEDVFRRHMSFLKKNGYSTVGLETLTERPPPPGAEKRVVITFDDGYRDFYTTAFPILHEFGFTATVFLPTQFIGSDSPGLREKCHLSWQEVRALVDQQIEFGSHTVTHCLLVNENGPRITAELNESKKAIEDRIGRQVRIFAYPYAFPDHRKKFTAMVRSILVEAGYRCGVTTKIGLASTGDDHYFLKRIPINSFDDEELFKAKLIGAYDWMNIPQYLFKNLKMFISIKPSGKRV